MDFEPTLDKMKRDLEAAQEEILMAIMFHETWRPAAYDKDVIGRMGNSMATHSFEIIRLSLRRQMMLGLTKLWDKSKGTVRMSDFRQSLSDEVFFEKLVLHRAGRVSSSCGILETMRELLTPRRDEVVTLIRKYERGGSGFAAFSRLKNLRDERLAHRNTAQEYPAHPENFGQEIEQFYQDNLELVSLLLSLVLGRSFDLSEAGGVYSHYAKLFWANARGENTDGHPNYRR